MRIRHHFALALTAALLLVPGYTALAQSGSADIRTVVASNGGTGGQLVVEIQARQNNLQNADGDSAPTVASGTVDVAYETSTLTFDSGTASGLQLFSGYQLNFSEITDPSSEVSCQGAFVRTNINGSFVSPSGFAGYDLTDSYTTLFTLTFDIAGDAAGSQSFTFCQTSLNLSVFDDDGNSDEDGGTIEAEPSGGDVVLGFEEASDVALPVELTSFDAIADAGSATLQWETASETNNAGFSVEHQQPGVEAWAEAGFVAGAGTTLETQVYSYRLEELKPGTHRFRLRQLDFDGAFEYSAEVKLEVALVETFRLSQVYPNPTAGEARVDVVVREDQAVTAEIYDVLGRAVRVVYNGQMRASTPQVLKLDTEGLPSGLYFIRLIGERFNDTAQFTLAR
ncbi:MAG: T9SS type A sorting domain-containing protein [Bacteroidota bacterium]